MGAAPRGSAPGGPSAAERRVLNPRPFRVVRKEPSTAEARAGALVLAGLAAVAGWVAWRGGHPDPSLLADPALQGAKPVAVVVDRGPVAAPDVPGRGADRGGLTAGLAAPGFTEGAVARYDAENLYEKIDGRAEFFLSRGFRSLTSVSLDGPGGTAVDVELYDLGSPQNALGAFAAERAPGVKAASGGGTSWYAVRNALFVARGSSYVRAIGSDESPAVLGQLEALRGAFEREIAAAPRTWTEALFAEALGLGPDRLEYAAENAFSFGFARNVTSARLADGETELFVAPSEDPARAKALAARFTEGFLSYGEKAQVAGVAWVRDRYLGSLSRAVAAGSFVVGVRGAPDAAAAASAASALGKLEKAVLALPPEVARKATESPAGGVKAGSARDGGDGGDGGEGGDPGDPGDGGDG